MAKNAITNGRAAANGNGSPRFVSGPQVVFNRGFSYAAPSQPQARANRAELVPSVLLSDRMFVEMLRDPTIKLATRVAVATLILQPWIIDGEDDDQCNFIWSQLEPWRTMIVRSAYRGMLRHGWRALEWVGQQMTDAPYVGGTKMGVWGVKALRGILTTPLIYEDTGDFAGVRAQDFNGNIDYIDENHTVFVNADEDYIGELGKPELRDVQETYQKWEKCDEGAQRYDDKVAGGFLAVGYPEGVFRVSENGAIVEKDGVVIAEQFAKSIKAAGYGLYPRKKDPETEKYDQEDWKFDHIASAGGGMQPSFVARQKYLDSLKLRSFGVPERAVTEGSFGTKAEAEAHAEVALVVNSERLEFILHGVNEGLVKPLCQENFSDENACRVKIGEMSEADKALLGQIIMQLLKDPTAAGALLKRLDIEQTMDKLDIPTTDTPQVEVPDPAQVAAQAAAAQGAQQNNLDTSA